MNPPAARFQPADSDFAERTLSIARAEVYARHDGRELLVAAMQQTLMLLPDTPDIPE